MNGNGKKKGQTPTQTPPAIMQAMKRGGGPNPAVYRPKTPKEEQMLKAAVGRTATPKPANGVKVPKKKVR